MRIHAVGLPHSSMDGVRNPDCAFTQRLLRWTQMMAQRGHDVILYGHGGESNRRAFENAEVVPDLLSEDEFQRWFDGGAIHGMDTEVTGVPTFNRRVIAAMRQRIEPQDFILLTWGRPQLAVAEAFPDNISIEGAIGYGDRVLPYAVFDTYTWMHYMYGRQGMDEGRFFDAAILGPFDPDQFLDVGRHNGYLIHIARLTPLKGVGIAQTLAEALDMPLVVCGGGDESLLTYDKVDYRGVVDHVTRARLLREAVALVAPTQYIEPGGQVVVEAAMAGVPSITTDFGCFLETVQPYNGWRCHTMSEFILAAHNARGLSLESRQEIQDIARRQYGYDSVGAQWENYLLRLMRLYGPGFYG